MSKISYFANNHYTETMRAASYSPMLVLSFFLGIGIVAAILSPSTPAYSNQDRFITAGGVGIMAFGYAFIVWLARFIGQLRRQRRIQRLTNGELWAEWQYSPTEWDDILADLQPETPLYRTSYTWIAMLIIGIISVVFTITTPPEARLMVGGVFGYVVLFVGFWSWLGIRRQRHNYRPNNPSPRLYIGSNALYHETEGYIPLDKLQSVELTNRPRPMIAFSVMMSMARGRRYPVSVNIPIPQNYIDQAPALVARFQAEKNLA